MKPKLILFVISLLYVTGIVAGRVNDDSLYRRLDEAIKHSPEYVTAHEMVIDRLRVSYEKAKDNRLRYNLATRLYDEYKSYMSDSAFAYLNRCVSIARKAGRNDLVGNSMVLLAMQSSQSGMYTEALDLLKKVSPRQLDHAGLSNYYMAYTHVYYELGVYTTLNNLRGEYMALAAKYSDSLYAVADKNSEDYLLRKEIDQFGRKRYSAALAINDLRMSKTPRDSRGYAIVAYYRSQIYRARGDEYMTKYWLAESAVADIKHAVMDQGALWNLAYMLDKEGQSERSYEYIRFTSNCNNHFNTRMRNWQIAPVLSVIDNNYQIQTNRTNMELKIFVVIVSLLSILLLWLLVYGYVQNKRLSVARNAQMKANDELERLNERLDTFNHQLSQTNEKLFVSNERLNESNRIKEEYIGRFLSICSQYVDKLDDYRRTVNRKIKNGEIDDLYKESKSTALKDKELDELYASFDTAFLNLFPNFVDDFNAMLRPAEQIYPTDKNRLTTDLRIFALIRLGIEDSSRIAEFLHYSVNTIYNYRARVKNGALTGRDNFERMVKGIGMNS